MIFFNVFIIAIFCICGFEVYATEISLTPKDLNSEIEADFKKTMPKDLLLCAELASKKKV